jgi:hypothetical protein
MVVGSDGVTTMCAGINGASVSEDGTGNHVYAAELSFIKEEVLPDLRKLIAKDAEGQPQSCVRIRTLGWKKVQFSFSNGTVLTNTHSRRIRGVGTEVFKHLPRGLFVHGKPKHLAGSVKVRASDLRESLSSGTCENVLLWAMFNTSTNGMYLRDVGGTDTTQFPMKGADAEECVDNGELLLAAFSRERLLKAIDACSNVNSDCVLSFGSDVDSLDSPTKIGFHYRNRLVVVRACQMNDYEVAAALTAGKAVSAIDAKGARTRSEWLKSVMNAVLVAKNKKVRHGV